MNWSCFNNSWCFQQFLLSSHWDRSKFLRSSRWTLLLASFPKCWLDEQIKRQSSSFFWTTSRGVKQIKIQCHNGGSTLLTAFIEISPYKRYFTRVVQNMLRVISFLPAPKFLLTGKVLYSFTTWSHDLRKVIFKVFQFKKLEIF